MRLTELLSAVDAASWNADTQGIDITGLAYDSRRVQPGNVFFAMKGVKADGRAYVNDAIRNGAIAVVCEPPLPEINDAIAIKTPNARCALSRMAAKFYAKQPEKIVAVTGTDGKTSTAQFCQQLAGLVGNTSAALGTIGLTGAKVEGFGAATHTTPDPIVLHQLLAKLAQDGVEFLSMEASSHGLDQYRLDGVKLTAAAFTNLTRDHLDYHGTDEAYFNAKARLFEELLPEGGTAVLNADDKRAGQLEKICKARRQRVVTFGRSGKDFKLLELTPTAEGQMLKLEIHGKPQRLSLPLYGAFQVMNVMAALALVEATGVPLPSLLGVVENLRGVRGRLENVASRGGALVFVDYAHTPAGLENMLKSIRPHAQGKLHLVFGAGGDRDQGKRPEMGKVAAKFADVVIVTDDNPRSENPADIRRAIMAACPGATEMGDRGKAITFAVQQLRGGDVLVIAGKGHETTQIIGDKTIPFDDAEVARVAAKEAA